MNIKKIIFFLFFLTGLSAYSQVTDRFTIMEEKLKELAKTTPGLNETVDLSFSNTPIQEFLKTMATTNNINISVDPGINIKITNNFSNVTAGDVLIFVCKKYDLDLSFIGNIISITTYIAPTAPPKAPVIKELKISYDPKDFTLSMDLNNDSLQSVAKKITTVSKHNVVYSPELANKMVSGFIQDTPFNSAMDKLAFANDLKVTLTEDNFYLVEKKEKDAPPQGSTKARVAARKGSTVPQNVQGLSYKVQGDTIAFVTADNSPIQDVVAAISAELKTDYFVYSELKGNASLSVSNVSFPEFLDRLFNGTEYTFKRDSGIYLIGNRTLEGLRTTKVFRFKYRTAEKLVDVIPADLKKGLEIKPFPDLNGIIMSGSQPAVNEVEDFFRKIDKVVPVIMIEVMITDVNRSKTLATKIEAGLKKGGAGTPDQKLYPDVNMSLNANSVNQIINGINGLGLLNLGHVTPNFYLTLQALESQGILKLRSTPRLSTLNGHEASLTNTRTEYYLEITNNVIGTQNPQNQISQSYKSVNADFSLKINPTVSGDEYITLDVKVKQSNFTARINPNAPPGTTTRDFQSMIRVKNQEVILLGGLEEDSMNDSGAGLPLLSRIPIIKWLFSSRTKARSNSKLTVFIKPTVIF